MEYTTHHFDRQITACAVTKISQSCRAKPITLPLLSCEQNSGMHLVCDKLKKSQPTNKQMFLDLAQCGWIWKRFRQVQIQVCPYCHLLLFRGL